MKIGRDCADLWGNVRISQKVETRRSIKSPFYFFRISQRGGRVLGGPVLKFLMAKFFSEKSPFFVFEFQSDGGFFLAQRVAKFLAGAPRG